MPLIHFGILVIGLWLILDANLNKRDTNTLGKEIVRTMKTQKCITTTVENIKLEPVSIRHCVESKQ